MYDGLRQDMASIRLQELRREADKERLIQTASRQQNKRNANMLPRLWAFLLSFSL